MIVFIASEEKPVESILLFFINNFDEKWLYNTQCVCLFGGIYYTIAFLASNASSAPPPATKSRNTQGDLRFCLKLSVRTERNTDKFLMVNKFWQAMKQGLRNILYWSPICGSIFHNICYFTSIFIQFWIKLATKALEIHD